MGGESDYQVKKHMSAHEILCRRMLRFALFIAVTLIIVCMVNYILKPEYYYGVNSSSATSSFLGFYKMEENAIDVLLMGNSHMGSGINPQDMYEAEGIRAYSLASAGQPIWVTYYWLKEALKYQSPKIVVLDLYSAFTDPAVDQETVETDTRRSLDDMRPGLVKWQAARTVCELDESQNFWSYFAQNIRYHNRWSQMEETDFVSSSALITSESKGNFQSWEICGDESYSPLTSGEIAAAESSGFGSTAAPYLDKITELCAEEGIELILIKTPTHYITAECHATMQEYADQHQLTLYDFNTEELYEEIGFDYANDMSDSYTTGRMNAHANSSGARKMSVWLAGQLIGINGLESVCDDQWEASREFNAMQWEDFLLVNEEDLLTYLEMLNNERYSFFMTWKKTSDNDMPQEAIDAIRTFGLEFDTSKDSPYAYCALRTEGNLTEIVDGYIDTVGTMRNGMTVYSVTMEASTTGSTGTISVDGTEYRQDRSGLYIVVYDNELHSVIDAVCFDTSAGTSTAFRTEEDEN